MSIDRSKILSAECQNPGYIRALMDSLGDEDKGQALKPYREASSAASLLLLSMLKETKETVKPTIKSDERVGRNDPCPCGALRENGRRKKYKHCCGR